MGEVKPVKLITLLVLLVTVSAGFYYWHAHLKVTSGQISPRLQRATAEEIRAHIISHKRKLTLINYWATWCEPCKLEFPRLLEIRNEYRDRGVDVVFVSLDEASEAGAVDEFLKSNGVDFITYFKHDQPLGMAGELFPGWSGAIPATLMLGGDGQYLDGWEGDTSKSEFISRIEAQLRGAP